MKRKILLIAVLLPLFLAGQQPIIIDHTCIDLDQIPDEYIDSAQANLWIGYGCTSHGTQLTFGMEALENYFVDGTYDWGNGAGGSDELHVDQGGGGYLEGDCGDIGWDNETREYLDDHPGCNVMIWSWCNQVNSVDLQSHYLGPMDQLESDYPDVQFVYMTGHLQGLGPGGSLYLANQQIRDYCTANNKILYDYADIEKYNPDADTNYQEYYATDGCDYNPPGGGTANWANNWLAANPGHELTQISQLCSSCPHSVSLNCIKKAIASWFLWTRLAGWESSLTSDFLLPDTTCIFENVDITYTGNASDTATYHWDFDGATIISGSGQGPYTLEWSSIGDKTVSLYIEESGIVSDTTTNNIYIEYITSDFQLPDTAGRSCLVDIIYIGNASDSAIYNWNFDGATIISGSAQGPYLVEWPNSGDKTVSLYVEESGFVSDTTTNDIYIVFLTSDFQLPDTSCIASTVDIIYTGNATSSASYNWDFDNATIISGSGQGPYTVQWPGLGNKIVSLYVEESGFVSDTSTNDIYISTLTSSFDLQDTACITHIVDLTYTGNASISAIYNWAFDGATILSGTGQGPYVLQWPGPGDKIVSLYVEDSGYVSDTTANEIYIEYLTSDFQLQDIACIFSVVDIIYTGNASFSATYYWDFDGATIISGSGQGPYMVEWPSSGDKTVSLYVEESGFVSDTSASDIYIKDKPVFTIIPYPNDTVTTMDTINLTGDLTSASYLWSTGDTTQSIQVTNCCGQGGGSQNYWLWITDEDGCSSVDSITVVFVGPTFLNEFPKEIEIKVFPNPFSDNVNIELEIIEKGQYLFEVYDCIGLPSVQETRHLKPGKQKINVDMDHARPGVYILSIKSDGGQIGVKKVIKSSN